MIPKNECFHSAQRKFALQASAANMDIQDEKTSPKGAKKAAWHGMCGKRSASSSGVKVCCRFQVHDLGVFRL